MSLSTEKPTEQDQKGISGFQQDLEHLKGASLLRGLEYECLKPSDNALSENGV